MAKREKIDSDFYKGQNVSAGRYGPPLVVIEVKENQIVCWDMKAAVEKTYSPSQLYPL